MTYYYMKETMMPIKQLIYPSMKNFTKYAFLIAAAGSLALGGCKKSNKNDVKKNDSSGYVKTVYNTNPVTATASCDYDVSDTALTNHGWTKSFDDEFDNGLTNWGAVPGGVNKEFQLNQAANVAVSNGMMTITAKRESASGPKTVGNDTTANFNFTSGWVISSGTFAASSATPKIRIVARVKTAGGLGLTSNFYTFGANAWPTNGEIDMMQVKGNDPKTYAFDYFWGTALGKSLVTDGLMFNPTTEDLSACFHVFMMEWTKNTLRTYIDGNLVETSNSSDRKSVV